MRPLCAIAALLALTSCSWIGRQADALGEHLPVIGDRCEHWQCVTGSGQAKSEEIKKEQAEAANPKPVTPLAPLPDATLKNTPPPEHHLITAPPM